MKNDLAGPGLVELRKEASRSSCVRIPSIYVTLAKVPVFCHPSFHLNCSHLLPKCSICTGTCYEKVSKVAGQTLDCYCICCELLSASKTDALQFVNILVSGIFHGRFTQRLAVNKPCLQIIRRLLWKQTTTHSLRNNNPMFDGNL